MRLHSYLNLIKPVRGDMQATPVKHYGGSWQVFVKDFNSSFNALKNTPGIKKFGSKNA